MLCLGARLNVLRAQSDRAHLQARPSRRVSIVVSSLRSVPYAGMIDIASRVPVRSTVPATSPRVYHA